MDRLQALRMENYDVAPLSLRAIKLGPIIAESDANGMVINPVGPLAGIQLESDNKLPHRIFDYPDRLLRDLVRGGQGRRCGGRWDG